MTQAANIQTLSDFFMFSELGSEQIEALAAASQNHVLERGEILFHQGDEAKGLYILLSGKIKLCVTSAQGIEKVISIVSPGQSFGEAIVFLEGLFPVSAHASVDSEVLMVPKQNVLGLLDNSPLIARKMLAALSIRMHQLVHSIETLSLQSGVQRFISYLLQISAEALDVSLITLPAPKNTIASLLNLTPETLSRILTKLQQLGLIEVQGKDILLTNIAKLRRIEMGSDYLN